MDEINVAAGIDNLLQYNNLDILRLLAKDNSVDIVVITERAKLYFLQCDHTSQISLINFLLDMDVIDDDFAQIILVKMFEYYKEYDEKFNLMGMGTVKRLISCGAVIPAEPKYLCKLKLNDFIEQVAVNQYPIDYELEAQCVNFHNIDVVMWIRKNTCEPPETIMVLITTMIRQFVTDQLINVYINEFINDPVLIDDIFVTLFYFNRTTIIINNCAHVCSEEFSFFIILYHTRHESLFSKSLLPFLHPNIKKYIGFNMNKYLSDDIYNLYSETVYPVFDAVPDVESYRNRILKNSRVILDHIESACVFDD